MSNYGEYTPMVIYDGGIDESPIYYRVCPKCGRYVKADKETRIPEYQGKEPNATCRKCGRVLMPFAGWAYEEEE